MDALPPPTETRLFDVTLANGVVVPTFTLYPADVAEVVGQPDRLVLTIHHGKDVETVTVFLGAGMVVTQSTGWEWPMPLDENGEPRPCKTVDEYRMLVASRAKL